MSNGWRWFWRGLSVLAIVLSRVSLSFVYATWTAMEVRPVASGNNVTLDSLSVQLDLLALTMTAIGIGLGVIGLFGYQNIRDMAVAKAAEEARKTAQSCAGLDRTTPQILLSGSAKPD